ncbi:DUF342 domain-containing protein [Cupriavidus oxalaticus]|jgi:uncharacterized protein (DUF342 family)|uniref:DUF342 domain-containing protein n=1 Tax=Cupriavidus oxalaticus TaxID=96344 RepID=A0A5P3VI46_9BURK|nr:FapA family protein [Cupriavidus oxalaticus]QEZ45997.1 DUF342 domain-containing protein [Cupriavidus oxalaticus]
MMHESGLRLELTEPGEQVHARYVPEPGRLAPDHASLKQCLDRQGWAGARLDARAVAQFLQQCQRAEHEIDAAIGVLVDGAFELDITNDGLAVRLTLMPAEGGRPVTQDDIRRAVAERGVVPPLQALALDAALAEGRCELRTIAAGVAPRQGEPARFLNLLQPRKPAQADEGDSRVDLRDLGNLLLVSPGTPLMRRVPAVPGHDGVDVFGKPIAADPMDDPPFAEGLTGAAADPDDPDLLVAVIAGAPVVGVHGIAVSPVVQVEAVDLHSGNVAFDGTLRVAGDIRTGMSVRVSGDVLVEGTIEAADIDAGGNVVVRGGIIGKAETGRADGGISRASVRCKGAVKARFIENAVVEAGTEVNVDSGIRQSDVAAGERIVVGGPGVQGSISGGRTRAMLAVRAAVLGSPAGSATNVQVGLNPYADAQRAALEADRRRLLEEQNKVKQLVAFFAAHPEKAVGDLREKARATLFKLSRDLFELEGRLAELGQQMQPSADAVIDAARRIHGGVTLQVGSRVLKVMEDKPGGQIRLVEDRIAVT